MMQSCPNCQQPNRPEAKFCAACGATLGQSTAEVLPETVPPAPPTPEATPLPPGKVLCPHCGKTVAARAKFCNYCGQSLTSAAPAVLAAATAPDAEPLMTAPPPSVAANEQPVPQVDASSTPVAQPSEQAQSLPAMQSTPPPYFPPAYTPKQQKLSRSQKIIVFAMGGAVALILIALLFVAFGGASPVSPTPTGAAAPMVTPSPPLVSPIVSDTAAPRQTSTPRVIDRPFPQAQDTVEIKVLEGDFGILDVVARYCADKTNWSTEVPIDYARRVAETTGIPWNNGNPIIHLNDVLRMPPCPQ